jgi:hypothetical protein
VFSWQNSEFLNIKNSAKKTIFRPKPLFTTLMNLFSIGHKTDAFYCWVTLHLWHHNCYGLLRIWQLQSIVSIHKIGCSAAIIQAKKRRPSQNLAIEKSANRGIIQSIRGDSEGESVFATAFIRTLSKSPPQSCWRFRQLTFVGHKLIRDAFYRRDRVNCSPMLWKRIRLPGLL